MEPSAQALADALALVNAGAGFGFVVGLFFGYLLAGFVGWLGGLAAPLIEAQAERAASKLLAERNAP